MKQKDLEKTHEFEDKCYDKKKGPQQFCRECFNKNMARTVNYELSEYGKSENMACSFLHTEFKNLNRAASDIQQSEDFSNLSFDYWQSPADRDIRYIIKKMWMQLQSEH